MSEKKYPKGGYAPGSYHCHCATCGGGFIGDKRAYQCEPCAIKDKAKFDALSPAEQEALVKKNAAAIQEALKDWGKKPEIKQSSAVWVKANTRLPEHRKDVIVIGLLNEQGYSDYRFVAFGHKAGPPGNEQIYFEYGCKSFLTNDVEWLDESPAEQPVVKKINREWLNEALVEFVSLYHKSTNKDIANDAAEYLNDKLKEIGIEYISYDEEKEAPEQPVREVEFVIAYTPCLEDDPDYCGDYTSNDGRELCHLKEIRVPVSAIKQLPAEWSEEKEGNNG